MLFGAVGKEVDVVNHICFFYCLGYCHVYCLLLVFRLMLSSIFVCVLGLTMNRTNADNHQAVLVFCSWLGC